jgi:plastocyanin
MHEVSMSGFKFAPATLEVNAGDVVEWKNGDFVAHTATADDHTFDTGQIDGGQAKRLVARKKGRFPYFCRYHLSMKGTLVVK